MFSKAKIKDKVYHIGLGWGEVAKVTEHHCIVRFNGDNTHYFEFDGRKVSDKHPTLFWDEPTIIPPKRKVKREGWVNVYHSQTTHDVIGETGTTVYKSKEKAVSAADGDYIATVKVEWEEKV